MTKQNPFSTVFEFSQAFTFLFFPWTVFLTCGCTEIDSNLAFMRKTTHHALIKNDDAFNCYWCFAESWFFTATFLIRWWFFTWRESTISPWLQCSQRIWGASGGGEPDASHTARWGKILGIGRLGRVEINGDWTHGTVGYIYYVFVYIFLDTIIKA